MTPLVLKFPTKFCYLPKMAALRKMFGLNEKQNNIRSPASDVIAPSFRGNLFWHSKIILVPNIAAKKYCS